MLEESFLLFYHPDNTGSKNLIGTPFLLLSILYMIYFVNEVMLAPMINQSSNIDYLLAHTTHKYCVTYLQREAVAIACRVTWLASLSLYSQLQGVNTINTRSLI